MSAALYHSVYIYTVIILTFISFATIKKSYAGIRRVSNDFIPALLLCIVCAFWIGMRPISGRYFVDTVTYAESYDMMQHHTPVLSEKGEWVWRQFMYYCSQVMGVQMFFTIVSVGYFGFTLWSCKRLTPNNVLVAFLFCLGAFSCFSYSTNGIRNGLACSMVLLSLSFVTGNNKDKIIAAVIAFVAFNIHHSTGLPILMAVVSLLFIRSFKWAYTFWIVSILISLVAGEEITSFFASLGFDDRVSYLQSKMDENAFRHTGFRWDFLIYSMMPILLGYYIIYRRGIRNATYEFLLNTYTLSNAFWVMVIRANFSNRFAYLSWFMYPIVLVYPLLKVDVWGANQGKNLKLIMFAQVAFTWFMVTIY